MILLFHTLFFITCTGRSAATSLQARREVAHSAKSNLDTRDAFDVSRYAALGDSYASGPSAGDAYDDRPKCRRYKQAFGPQVAADPRIKGPKPIQFNFIACSGSRFKQIYADDPNPPPGKPGDSQAKQLQNNPDMVSMSIGGNDADFVKIMDRVGIICHNL